MNASNCFFQLVLRLTLPALVLISCEALRPISSTTPARKPAESSSGAVGSSAEARTRTQVVALAQEQLGVDYKYAGRDPRSGFDCSGFTRYVLNQVGVSLAASSQTQINNGRPRNLDAVQPGDLLFFRRSSSEPIFHVALVVKNDRNGIEVIHSTTSRGVVRDNISRSTYWAPKLTAARNVISR